MAPTQTSPDWCDKHSHFLCGICMKDYGSLTTWQHLISQKLPDIKLVQLMMSYLTRCMSEEKVTSEQIGNFVYAISWEVKWRPDIYQASFEGASYSDVLVSLLSYQIDKEIEEVRMKYSEASSSRLGKLCARIFHLLSSDLNSIPEVLLGNLDDITTDHLRLSRMIIEKLSSLKHQWNHMGFTKFVTLCSHVGHHADKIGMKKSQVEKIVLSLKAPKGYLEFVRLLHEDLYDLLSVNEATLEYTLYKECNTSQLLDVVSQAMTQVRGLIEDEVGQETAEAEADEEMDEDKQEEDSSNLEDMKDQDMFVIDRSLRKSTASDSSQEAEDISGSAGEEDEKVDDIKDSSTFFKHHGMKVRATNTSSSSEEESESEVESDDQNDEMEEDNPVTGVIEKVTTGINDKLESNQPSSCAPPKVKDMKRNTEEHDGTDEEVEGQEEVDGTDEEVDKEVEGEEVDGEDAEEEDGDASGEAEEDAGSEDDSEEEDDNAGGEDAEGNVDSEEDIEEENEIAEEEEEVVDDDTAKDNKVDKGKRKGNVKKDDDSISEEETAQDLGVLWGVESEANDPENVDESSHSVVKAEPLSPEYMAKRARMKVSTNKLVDQTVYEVDSDDELTLDQKPSPSQKTRSNHSPLESVQDTINLPSVPSGSSQEVLLSPASSASPIACAAKTPTSKFFQESQDMKDAGKLSSPMKKKLQPSGSPDAVEGSQSPPMLDEGDSNLSPQPNVICKDLTGCTEASSLATNADSFNTSSSISLLTVDSGAHNSSADAEVASVVEESEPESTIFSFSNDSEVNWAASLVEESSGQKMAVPKVIDISESCDNSARSSPLIISSLPSDTVSGATADEPEIIKVCTEDDGLIELSSQSEDTNLLLGTPSSIKDRKTPQGTPSSCAHTPKSGRTPSSGGHTPTSRRRSRHRETIYGRGQEKELEKVATEYLNRSYFTPARDSKDKEPKENQSQRKSPRALVESPESLTAPDENLAAPAESLAAPVESLAAPAESSTDPAPNTRRSIRHREALAQEGQERFTPAKFVEKTEENQSQRKSRRKLAKSPESLTVPASDTRHSTRRRVALAQDDQERFTQVKSVEKTELPKELPTVFLQLKRTVADSDSESSVVYDEPPKQVRRSLRGKIQTSGEPMSDDGSLPSRGSARKSTRARASLQPPHSLAGISEDSAQERNDDVMETSEPLCQTAPSTPARSHRSRLDSTDSITTTYSLRKRNAATSSLDDETTSAPSSQSSKPRSLRKRVK
ncbi:dentin sialophosphoprotein-like isoform X2 [Watersipora subatra]|uniref:dentin sialophosphoprotein-like isoform X2 n=1 Tax=Watersipora subatra TaxID=2589382 RepID=UPI00355B94F7